MASDFHLGWKLVDTMKKHGIRDLLNPKEMTDEVGAKAIPDVLSLLFFVFTA
jgi:hypothetical protein